MSFNDIQVKYKLNYPTEQNPTFNLPIINEINKTGEWKIDLYYENQIINTEYIVFKSNISSHVYSYLIKNNNRLYSNMNIKFIIKCIFNYIF